MDEKGRWAKQFRRHPRQLRILRGRLRRIIRDIRRNIEGQPAPEAAYRRDSRLLRLEMASLTPYPAPKPARKIKSRKTVTVSIEQALPHAPRVAGSDANRGKRPAIRKFWQFGSGFKV